MLQIKTQPLQSLFVEKKTVTSSQACSQFLNSLEVVDICHEVCRTGRHTIFQVGCTSVPYNVMKADFGRSWKDHFINKRSAALVH